MDLVQRKLTKSEWNNTEVPVSADEKEILKLIMEGYNNTSYIYNKHTSLALFLKMAQSANDEAMNAYLYKEFFESRVKTICKKYDIEAPKISSKIRSPNKGESIRIANSKKSMEDNKEKIFELCLITLIEHILTSFTKSSYLKGCFQQYYDGECLCDCGHDRAACGACGRGWAQKCQPTSVFVGDGKKDKYYSEFLYYYYSLKYLMKTQIKYINAYIVHFVNKILTDYCKYVDLLDVLHESPRILENNEYLNYFRDYTLYDHQKQLFSFCKRNLQRPKLITYVAPTGTGKTLSPIGLSSEYKVIFVCAARHVGLALAKSAISIGKKIAFAFGCDSAEDIRLHYFAAKDYVKHNVSGRDIKYKDGSKKVDNSVGDNVEIMITDIKSYLCAMYYMLSFNNNEQHKLITYWDEPTITMDKENDENHKYIHDNWSKNMIQNMVLSSATLPPRNLIFPIIQDFKTKFPNAMDYEIISHDCNKSIPIVNKEGYVEMPHYMCKSVQELNSCVENCMQFRTLFRYFDLREIVDFLFYLRQKNIAINERYIMENAFDTIDAINMNAIKENYMNVLGVMEEVPWKLIYEDLTKKRQQKYKGNVMLTTKDAHSLVDGPTIYLADDVGKVASFMLQNAKIPEQSLKTIAKNIEFNNRLMQIITQKEKKLEDSLGDMVEKEHKMANMRISPEQKKLKKDIEELYGQILMIEMDPLYIPNTNEHLNKWFGKEMRSNEMTSIIEPHIVEKIMTLEIEDKWRVLLLMGIGVMTNHGNIEYNEIMKDLADKQKLYLIIASSDYIYGTNYQFCHGFIGKDLEYITQEKTIQAMGRIGRNQLSKIYSIRLRENSFIPKIFFKQDYSLEAQNMVRLFETDEDD